MSILSENYLVLDPGSSVIKGALYSRSITGHTLLRLESIPCNFCYENEEEYKKVIQSFIEEQFPDVHSIVVLIPAEYVYIRDLKLPVTSESRARQILPYEVENLLPIQLDAADVTGQVWKTEGEFSYILSLTATHELLSKTISPLKDSEIFFKMITVDSVAISETVSLLPQEDVKDKIIVQIHIGSQSTVLNVISSGRLSLTRSLPYGGADLTEIISGVMRYPFEDADEVKVALQINILENSRKPKDLILKSLKIPIAKYNKIHKEISEYFKELADEIERTFLSIPDLRIDSFYLSGGSSQFRGLSEYMEERLEVPVRNYPSEILQGNNPALWMPVLGAAIHFAKPSRKRYDFTKTSFGKFLKVGEINWNRMRFPGILTAAASVILLLSFVFGIVYDKYRISDVRKEIAAIAKRIPDIPKTGNPIKAAQDLCNKKSGVSTTDVKFIDVFQNITENMPGADRSSFRLTKFNFESKDVNFEANIDNLNEVSEIETSLKKSSMFSSVETQSDLIANKKVKLKVKLKIKPQSTGNITGCG